MSPIYQLPMKLFLRHSAKSLIAQEERMVPRLHLSHAIVVRLRVRRADVVTLSPETAGTLVFEH